MAITKRLGFLGFGNMGSAIARGLIETGKIAPDLVTVFDPDDARRSDAENLGLAVAESPKAFAKACDVLVIAVKPQQFTEAVTPLVEGLKNDALAVSIMAGVGIDAIGNTLTNVSKIARVMPNLPAVVGAGASAVAYSDTCSEADHALVRTVFEAVGVVEEVDESQLDAVTAVSGSGPAYFFYLVECMAAAGEAQGLARDQAERLAAQTAYGAGVLMHQSPESPATLRERVTSKGGTTFAALEAFRANKFDAAVAAGVSAAAARSKELGS